ncbi:helix-turn-helix domain-containing GNAT family N-acetyltransferase [Cryptosporangium sp. NPDC051539]|uniref:helix-turn-helix domain-containing GNAT family N-acetyltransferase n=1 Tax=Cryptosporangium sp. NPDC051539 TaxID=3363962 RepID=UPI00379B30E9
MSTPIAASSPLLPEDADRYARWFACLAEPVRVRLLHAVAATPGGLTVGALTEVLGVGQSTVSHHIRTLAKAGFVNVRKERTATVVTVNAACSAAFPQAADAVMGLLGPRSATPVTGPDDVRVRALAEPDWDAVLRIYAAGIATGNATFETVAPSQKALDAKWLPGHRWVAEIDGAVVGWTASTPSSARECYAGVVETSVYVAECYRGRRIGTALLHRQVTAADEDGLWTLQTSIFPENRASLALHHAAGYRTVGIRERIARREGVWRDTVLLERRSPSV